LEGIKKGLRALAQGLSLAGPRRRRVSAANPKKLGGYKKRIEGVRPRTFIGRFPFLGSAELMLTAAHKKSPMNVH